MNEIHELSKAVAEFSLLPRVIDLVPEVGSNFVFAKESACSLEDVAGVEGRIRKGRNRVVFGEIVLGASQHAASVVLEFMKREQSKRSALNLLYSERLVESARAIGFTVVEVDRAREPSEVKEKEGESMFWEAREAIAFAGSVPDCFYSKESVGKEGIFWVIAETPAVVLEKFKKIFGNVV